MGMLRFDHVGVVVDDLEAATAFFLALGFEREVGALVESEAVDKINGLDGVRAEVVIDESLCARAPAEATRGIRRGGRALAGGVAGTSRVAGACVGARRRARLRHRRLLLLGRAGPARGRLR